MAFDTASEIYSHDPLLWWCVAGSVAAHVLMLTLVPGWRAAQHTPPIPLSVELREPPAEIEPPKSLPAEATQIRPTPPQRPKAKPEPMNPAPREERPVEQPRAPILTASPEVPPSPAVPVVPEQTPAPPPAALPAPIAAPATPPRSDAAYLNNPRPPYPLAARRRGDQGTVLVRVLVTAQGLAASVSLEKTSGHPSLDEAALAAVKTWRFVPARQGGQAVDAPFLVPMPFKLE